MRFFVSLLIAVGLIVLVFVLILKSFSSHPTSVLPKPLTSYSSTNTVMQLTVTGPITADPNHNIVQISVGQSQSELKIIQGYQNTVTNTQTYPNNQSAYLYFLSALSLAGFTRGSSNAEPVSDYGYCPFGDHYNYQIINNRQVVQNFWADSCGDRAGTFEGEPEVVRELFTTQIPDYNALTDRVRL